MNPRMVFLSLFLAVCSTAGFTQSAAPSNNSKPNSQPGTLQGQRSGPTNSPIPTQPQKDSPPNAQNGPQIWSNWAFVNGPPLWSNWVLVFVAAFTAIAAIKTLRAIKDQVVEMRKTGEQTEKLIQENIAQSTSLEQSVKETARFAAAVEGVAKSLETTAQTSTETLRGLRTQMRAHLTVIIGSGAIQSRKLNLRFDAKPLVINAGPTPARNVRTRTKSAILPVPLPEDFDQSIAIDEEEGGNLIGAHQNAQMIAVVDDYVPDEQVEDIKAGRGPSMYTWGFVTYEDVFGESHTTKFCQRLTWLPDGQVYGYYIPGRNDAD